jgi:hypothetical protein
MIKTLTPYYISIPFVSPLTGATAIDYTINLYIWNGNKNTPPFTPQYSITKSNPESLTGFDKINIANLLNDFIEFTPKKSTTTELINGDNQVWVRKEIIYKTNDSDDDDVLQLAETFLALKGYGYGLSGENPQPPANKILIPIQDYKVNRNGFFNVPILIDEPTDESEIVITNVVNTTGSTYQYSFTSNFTFTTLQAQVRAIGSSSWSVPTTFAGVTSPQTRVVSLGSSFETRIFAFNELTGNIVYSNIFTV